MIGFAGNQLYLKKRYELKIFSLYNNLYVNKVGALMTLIQNKYVDSVDMKKISDKVIPEILQELDPHSTYITAKNKEYADEQIYGSFSGIGVQFNLFEDTIRVVSVIPGGPSERAGLKAGDDIVTIDDSIFAGKKIQNKDVMENLRGKKGTMVKVGIKRYGNKSIIPVEITRGDVPLRSVEAKYVLDNNVGYIKMTSFGKTTYKEVVKDLLKLKREGCDRFIIDLRSNTGGLLDAAVNIANEFLPDNRLILYTKGHSYPREDIKSNGRGSFRKEPVVVLIDEWSASASEILTGALQDNDRAYVVGRRSFGKGLVQNEIPFRDGSAVRLTIARFYIPSGRCIQKPYVNGADKNYQQDIYTRYENGEFEYKDSIHFADSLKYKTYGGRIVYGGGGIMPDYFVPLDTTASSKWLSAAFGRGLVTAYSLNLLGKYENSLSKIKTIRELDNWFANKNILSDFVKYTTYKKIKSSKKMLAASGKTALQTIEANLAKNLISEDAYWQIIQRDDNTVEKAVDVIKISSNEIAVNE